jgi:hypothetical protein
VSRLRGGIVNAYLKHRETSLQFDRTLLGIFLGAKLGLQATIDFESETGAVSEQEIFAEAIAAFYPDGKDGDTLAILETHHPRS